MNKISSCHSLCNTVVTRDTHRPVSQDSHMLIQQAALLHGNMGWWGKKKINNLMLKLFVH